MVWINHCLSNLGCEWLRESQGALSVFRAIYLFIYWIIPIKHKSRDFLFYYLKPINQIEMTARNTKDELAQKL